MSTRVHLQELAPARSSASVDRARAVDDDNVRDSGNVEPTVTSNAQRSTNAVSESSAKSPRYIVTCLAVLVFVVQLGASLSDVPSVRFLEDVICRRFYGVPSADMLPDKMCLVGAVQGELNMLTMGALIFGYLPGILVAVPCGALADRRGPKVVLFLCILGMILSQLWWIGIAWKLWDLRYLWSSSVFMLIGGGESVAEAMVFAIVSDVAPLEKRAIHFQIEICSVLLAEAVAPFVAAAMMKYSVWLPILVSPAIMTIGCFMIILIPETLDTRQRNPVVASTTSTSWSRTQQYDAQTPEPPSPSTRLRKSFTSTPRLLKIGNLALLLPGASLMIPVATVTMSIALRYLPIRFGWTLAQAGMVLGIRTGFNILVLLVLLPVLGEVVMCKQGGGSDAVRDLVLARISAVLLVVGQVVFAAAPNTSTALLGLAMLTLGAGAPSLCRAALTRVVDRGSVGRVFGLLAVCEMLGYLTYGVSLGALFQYGLGHGLGPDGTLVPGGQAFLSSVFSIAALIYFWSGGLIWFVKLKGRPADMESVHSEDPVGQCLHKERVLADGRATRTCPSLENATTVI